MIINGDIMEPKAIAMRVVVLTPMVSLCVLDAYSAVQRWSDKDAIYCGGMSYAAHVAGGFSGLFCGTFLLRNYEKLKWEKILQWICLGVYVVAFVTVFGLSIINYNIGSYHEQYNRTFVNCTNIELETKNRFPCIF